MQQLRVRSSQSLNNEQNPSRGLHSVMLETSWDVPVIHRRLTFNQFPTIGSAVGPGGRFILRSFILKLITIAVNTIRSRLCRQGSKLKTKSSVDGALNSTPVTNPITNIANKPRTTVGFSIVIDQTRRSKLKIPTSAQRTG